MTKLGRVTDELINYTVRIKCNRLLVSIPKKGNQTAAPSAERGMAFRFFRSDIGPGVNLGPPLCQDGVHYPLCPIIAFLIV